MTDSTVNILFPSCVSPQVWSRNSDHIQKADGALKMKTPETIQPHFALNWRMLVTLITLLIVLLATFLGAATQASAQTVCSPATALSVPLATTTTGKFCWH